MVDQELVFSTLDLVETMDQGINFMEIKVERLDIEATVPMLRDILDAFYTVESVVDPMIDGLEENEIREKTEELKSSFEELVEEYEGDGQRIYRILDSHLKPEFKDWKEEIELRLRPYIVS